MRSREILAVFNRGLISEKALARVDVPRVALSAEQQTNWVSTTLGPMGPRPGMAYLGERLGAGVGVPFVPDQADETALLVLSSGYMQVWQDGAWLSRPSVSTTVVNPTFEFTTFGWTDADEAGAVSTAVTIGADDYLQFTGTGSNRAIRRQELPIAGGDQNVVHALRIHVETGPVLLRIGTTAGADDLFRQAVLRTGYHSIAFTPTTASAWVELSGLRSYAVRVASVDIEAAGAVQLPVPWSSLAELQALRWAQSSDVVYVASGARRQQRIERRPNSSWSVVEYRSEDGPFQSGNVEQIDLTPSAISGEITLTASADVWRAEHVGALWRLTSFGQLVESDVAAGGAYSNTIRVTDVGSNRRFKIVISGTWSGTITLQRSVGAPGSWVNTNQTFTGNVSQNYNDGLDNSIVYYRIGFNGGDYTSGTATVSLDYANGSIDGVVEITGFTNAQSVSARVFSDLGGLEPTVEWAEGAWSDVAGWPTAVAMADGRLFWSHAGKAYGSVSDAFTSYDASVEGDSRPINRFIGDGSAGAVQWLAPLKRLVAGGSSRLQTLRSTGFEEPLTQDNYNSRLLSTRGAYAAPPALLDTSGYYISKSGEDIVELVYDPADVDYGSNRATVLVPELGVASGFRRLAAQSEPELRLFVVRANGTLAALIRDPAEDVMAWLELETDGVVEDVVVLPAAGGPDDVYLLVSRTVNNATQYYLEQFVLERECTGGTLCKLLDSHVTGTGPTATLAGLDHLEGREVKVWADGAYQGAYNVAGGAVTLPSSVTSWVAGLGYECTYVSSKFAKNLPKGPSLTKRSRLNKVGLILMNAHKDALRYGSDPANLQNMPSVENAVAVADNTTWASYAEDAVVLSGSWDTDTRLHLSCSAPLPVTVLAAVVEGDWSDGT